MSIADKILLRKRALIETANDKLKNIAQIEHSRHRPLNMYYVTKEKKYAIGDKIERRIRVLILYHL